MKKQEIVKRMKDGMGLVKEKLVGSPMVYFRMIDKNQIKVWETEYISFPNGESYIVDIESAIEYVKTLLFNNYQLI